MPENEPTPISEPVEALLVRYVRPDLLEGYTREKQRHREELAAIEQARRRARQWLKRLFSPLRERKEQELEEVYLERVQGEADRHDRYMAELRETLRDHKKAETGEEEPGL